MEDITYGLNGGVSGVNVRCTEKMRSGFEKLLKMDNIPTELKNLLEMLDCTENDLIPFSTLRSIQEFCKTQKGVYLHELIEDCEIVLPHYEPPKRNPELEARIQRLRNEQMNKEYQQMTRNVSLGRHEGGDLKSFGQEIKSVQKMLITIFNFALTVVGSFAFAFKATEYAMKEPNMAIQLCSGLVVGTMVFFADLYFVMKHEMVEEGTISGSVYDKKMN